MKKEEAFAYPRPIYSIPRSRPISAQRIAVFGSGGGLNGLNWLFPIGVRLFVGGGGLIGSLVLLPVLVLPRLPSLLLRLSLPITPMPFAEE
jgi:hypothetical protein